MRLFIVWAISPSMVEISFTVGLLLPVCHYTAGTCLVNGPARSHTLSFLSSTSGILRLHNSLLLVALTLGSSSSYTLGGGGGDRRNFTMCEKGEGGGGLVVCESTQMLWLPNAKMFVIFYATPLHFCKNTLAWKCTQSYEYGSFFML